MAKAVIAADRNFRSSRKFFDELDKLFGASIGVVVVRTREIERARALIHEWTSLHNYELAVWDHNHGFRTYLKLPTTEEGEHREVRYDAEVLARHLVPQGKIDNTEQLIPALEYMENRGREAGVLSSSEFQEGFIGVFLDLVEVELEHPAFIQFMRDHVNKAHDNDDRVFVLTQPHVAVPEGLRSDVVLIDLELPGFTELKETLTELAETSISEALDYEMDEDTIEQVAQNGLGMSEQEFSNAVAIATVELGKHENAEPNAADFIDVVRSHKLELIRQTEVLDFVDPKDIGNVGGLDLLKSDLEMQRKAFTQEARDFGLDMPKGFIVVGQPGCLAASTALSYSRNGHSTRNITLEELYKKFNGIKTTTKGWDTSIPTMLHSFDPDTGKVLMNSIVSVIDAGFKPGLEISTDTHGSVVCSKEHPILTSDGTFAKARDLRVGDAIIVRGSMLPRQHAHLHGRRPRVVVEGLKYYNAGWPHTVHDKKTGNTYEYKRQHKAVLVAEAHMNGLSYGSYLRRLKHDSSAVGLKTIPEGYVVHHMDEDPKNDTLGNLQVLPKAEHDALHSNEDNFNVEYTELSYITKIEYRDFVKMYDIQMEKPYNNFALKNGIIVHNTGKTLICKATSSVLGLPAISFNLSAVFSSYIGSSEQRMRANLKFVEAMAPCILFLDEFDKAVPQGNENDSGTSSRILGTFLTWLNDRQDRGVPVFVIASANDVSRIPPEMLRKGRFDNIWAVPPPSSKERMEIFRIHIEKRGHELSDADLEKLARRTNSFVGAEIENCVVRGLLRDFNEDNDVLTCDNVIAEINETIPQAKAFAERIAQMQDWIDKNAKPASSNEQLEDTFSASSPGTRRIRPKRKLKPGGSKSGID